MLRTSLFVSLVLACGLMAACGDDDGLSDAGSDSSVLDGGVDAGRDGGSDAGRDAGDEDGGGVDAGEDAGEDDAGEDAGPPDPIADVVINEIVANHRGDDTAEYIELFGDADTDLSPLKILVLEGDIDSVSSTPGVIEQVLDVGTTDASGFWDTGFLAADTLENGSQTYLLVQGFSGAALDDLDTDDDGTLDVTPWDLVLDEVSINDGTAGDLTYARLAELTPDLDAVGVAVGGASRLPNGEDTDAAADWTRNDFDGAGIASLAPGTPEDGEALNTPGAANAAAATPVAVINEFVFNHAGADTNEVLEVLGAPDADLSSLTIVLVEGDDLGQGRIDGVFPVGTTNASGYWSTTTNDMLENGSVTVLLVLGFTGVGGLDLDTDDDGTLDEMPWSTILDAFAISDAGAADLTYAAPVLTVDFDGGAVTVGGASRIPDGTDTDAVGDWVRNEFTSPGDASAAVSGEAINTPGAVNAVAL